MIVIFYFNTGSIFPPHPAHLPPVLLPLPPPLPPPPLPATIRGAAVQDRKTFPGISGGVTGAGALCLLRVKGK